MAPSHFTFLYSNDVAQGTVEDGSGDPVAGMTVTLMRCLTSAGSTKPPSAGTCTANFPGFTAVNAVTDADGKFSFPNLTEGVYQITPNPSTVAGYTASTPTSALYRLVGANDIEDRTFVVN